MPSWTAPGKSPALFPAAYAEAVQTAAREEGREIPLPFFHTSHDAARARAEDFRYWRFSLRHFTSGRGYEVEITKSIKTKIIQTDDLWRVMVIVRPRLEQLLAALD
jgi:hypothetical protein